MLFVSVMFYVLFSLAFWYVYFLSVFSLVSAYNICYDNKKMLVLHLEIQHSCQDIDLVHLTHPYTEKDHVV